MLIRLLIALCLAALVPAILMTGWYLYGQFSYFPSDDPYIWVRTRNFAIPCVTISALFVVLLGLPTFLVLKSNNRVNARSALIAGFFLAALPASLLTWPMRPGFSSSVGGVAHVVDGVPTFAGWQSYGIGLLSMGALGLAGASAFWFAYRHKP